MIDIYGQWHEEIDYNTYPEEKWCDYDYIANWIRKQNYEIKTDMENLISMIFFFYDAVEKTVNGYYAIEDLREYPDNIMIYVPDVEAFVKDRGGLKEFDHYVYV